MKMTEPRVRPADERSDDELVEAVRCGDPRAFECIVERHRASVVRLAGRFFHQRVDLEDVLQDTFVEAWINLGSYHPRKDGSFAAWCRRVAVHTCLDALRRVRRRREEPQADPEGGAAGAPAVESAVVTRDLAVKLLRRLPPEDRLVLVLEELEGASLREIAELTGWSLPKVKVRAHRARCRLRSLAKRLR